MTSQLLPPNPCLVAILLIVNYHHQPRIIFHYPPRPGEDNSHFASYLKSDLTDDETTTSGDEESSSSANDHSSKNGNREKSKSNGPVEVDMEEAGSVSPENFQGLVSMQRPSKWDDIFGYAAVNLAKLLCPAPSAHKKRFEMSLNDKAFIGWPLFARDGHWQRKKKQKRPKAGDQASEEKGQSRQNEKNLAGNPALQLEELDATSGQDTDVDGQHTSHDELETLLVQKSANPQSDPTREETYKPRKATEEPVSKDTLKMFHVVFVLYPPPLEYHLRTKEMYDHVIKKFSRALKWEQARSNYVSKEVSAISTASKAHRKASVSEPLASMYQQILLQSSLAKAISTLFNSISNSKIAHIHLTPTLSLSLQIPIATSTSILPSPIAPQLPGLWLTTANSLPTDDEVNTTTSQLASHFTLLLLSDLSNILSDVNAATTSPLSGPLAHYLHASKPTKSFLQISQTSGIALPDIQFLASHLIYWRRARAIPPLHQRDTYIVSPNADMQKLVTAKSSFARLFPTLPSLPKILNMLSFTPRPYSALIPTKNHKEAYLEILAWLLRHGWVTQLRTFAWIKVPSHVKEIVATQPEPAPSQAATVQEDASAVSAANLKSPLPNQFSPPSPTSSTHSNRTTFPYLSSPPTPSLIPDPRHASALPSRYLAAISAYVLEQQGKDTRCAWDRCVGYFDGRHAVEVIAVREGWKRKRVDELMAGWERLGILIRDRHW